LKRRQGHVDGLGRLVQGAKARWQPDGQSSPAARAGNANAKETIAVRIIELARRGERSPTKLRDRVLHEANDLIA
jgi:hypothetical protein